MSKYIKQDDVFELVRAGVLVGNSNFESVCKAVGSLPTIEVSEDCISREYILGEAFASNEYNRETKSFDLPVVSVIDIKDAPSVVPTTEQSSLVRCKDCKWFMDNVAEDSTDDECRWRTDEMPNADDYCSYGQKK